MSRALLARIAKLELRAGEGGRTKVFHRLWARPDMDAQQQAAAMIAAGKAREGDDFMVLTFMEPSEKPRLTSQEWAALYCRNNGGIA